MSSEPQPPVAPTAPSIDRENPWPGLRSYDESMHAFFFGRTAEVDELLRLVRRDPVALFYGQSGLGKSSVLQAGLFPKLRAGDMLPVHIRLRYSAEFPHPVEQVLREVVSAAHAAGGEAPAPAPGSSLFEYFYDERHEFWSARNRVLTPVLVFDQFEEIFTLGTRDAASRERREELLQQLGDLAAHRPPTELVRRFEQSPELAARFSTDRTRCRMLFSMREDFLPELGNLRQHLPTLPSGGLRLQRLTGTQAQEVLERPGAHLLADGVTERIIRFVAAEKSGSAGDLARLDVEPALLSVVASELNHRRKQRGLERISADLVQGARDEILNDFYERALSGLDRRVREFIEEQLLTTTGFRDSVAVEDAEASFGISRDVIAQLVDRRLLRIDERFQLQRVELTHDLLTAVVKSSRDRRRELQAAEAAQHRAEQDKRTAQAAAAQAQAKLKRTRIRVAVTGTMVLLGLGIVVPSILLRRASRARDEATTANQLAENRLEEAKQALSRYIIVQAKEHLARGDYDAARLVLTLADRGEAKMQLFPPAQLGLLSAALDEPPVLRLEGVLKLPPGVRQVTFAPGGRLLIVDATGALQVAAVEERAAADGAALATAAARGALGKVSGVIAVDLEWTQTGRLAVATETGDIAIFDLASGTEVTRLSVPRRSATETTETVASTATADSKDVLSGKGDVRPEPEAAPTVEVEKPGAAGAASMSRQRSAYAVAVRFSPDGTRLAVATSDGRVIVWQRATEDWSEAPTMWDTSIVEADSEDLSRTETELNWLLDGTLVVTHGAGGAWLAAPQEKWSSIAPLEKIAGPGARQAVATSENQLDSDVFVSRGAETRVTWNRYVASASAAGHVASVQATTAFPDRILDHAVIDQRRLLLTVMRDGAITVHRLVPATDAATKDALEIVQTVTGPKSARVDLTVRPDGRVLAATADDGRVFFYRVEAAPAAKTELATGARRFVHASDGWWQFSEHGSIIAPDGSTAGQALDAKAASGLPVSVHSICRPAGAADSALAFVSLAEVDPALGGRPVGVWSFATKNWQWKKSEQDFGLQRASDVARFEDAIQFSPDGRAVLIACQAESTVHMVATDDGRQLAAPIRLPAEHKIQRVAWSGDGRRIAIVSDDLQIMIADLGAAAAGKAPIVASVPARSYELSALALDQTGAVLGYVTPDNRLVLDFIEQNDELPSLIAPLSGPRPTGLAFAPDASGIVLFSDAGLSVRRAQSLAPEHIERIEWINQRTRQGFRFVPYPTDRPTDLRNLNVAAWREDAGNRAFAEFQRAWTGIVADWFAWVDAARTVVTRTPTPALENTSVTVALERGRSLVQRIETHRHDRPAVQAFYDRAAAAVAEPLAFYDFFEVTPLWSQVASYLMEGQTLSVISPRQAEKLFPKMVERLKSADVVAENEYALMKRLVTVLAANGVASTAVGQERAALRSEKLFTPEAWDQMVFASPDNELRATEAAALFEAGDYDGSIRYYSDLERRDPQSLRYATFNAQNFRFRREWDIALLRYQDVLTRARAQGQIDFAAEASVCAGWCLQGLGRLEEADAAMALGPEIAPENTWVLRYASAYFIDRGQAQRTAEWTERLVRLAGEPTHRIVRAHHLTAIGDHDGARVELNAAIDSGDATPQNYFDAGELIAYLGRKPDKELGANWLLEAYNKTTDRALEFRVLGALGPIWMTLNNYTGALSSYRLRLDNYEPDDFGRLDGHINSVWIQALTRDFESARQSLEQALALDAQLGDQAGNDRVGTWWKSAVYHEASGNMDAALAAYAKAAGFGGLASHRALVAALKRSGRHEEALRAVDRALAAHAGDPELRLYRAELLLASNAAEAQRELAALDDGSVAYPALGAAALRGQAAAAAERFGATLTDDPYAEESLELAGLHALAWRQTGDNEHRVKALVALSEALWNRHRGNHALRHEFGLDALRDDPIFAIAVAAITARLDSVESLLGLARVEHRVAALLPEGPVRTRRTNRAQGWINFGIEREKLTREDVLGDAELASYAPEEAEAEPDVETESPTPAPSGSGGGSRPGASHDESG